LAFTQKSEMIEPEEPTEKNHRHEERVGTAHATHGKKREIRCSTRLWDVIRPGPGDLERGLKKD